ncbi:hypothetical protein EST38_g9388 [Candolleomyces aberdarensis]|uniref:Uncharacterized protein n=1 Tax=Candolleomyces aberdarensis TaxID=2316362 RepID=A0A4Q2DA07_9AGAR|nr:hypothetical protein EST38_g9388 [Candolleomyces aberdarensis]
MIIDRIIRVTVQTGLITMIVASLDLITFLTDVSILWLEFTGHLSSLISHLPLTFLPLGNWNTLDLQLRPLQAVHEFPYE